MKGGLVTWFGAVSASALVVVACGKQAADPDAARGVESTPSTEPVGDVVAASPDARNTTPDDVTAPSPERGEAPSQDDAPTTIAGRLDAERKARTRVKPEVEDAFAAFAAAGLEVKDVRQGVARTSQARYCEFGTSPGGHRVLVCEFADAGEAERGAAFMAAQLVDPRRRVEARGRLALTVFSTERTPEADRERARYFEVFATLPSGAAPQ